MTRAKGLRPIAHVHLYPLAPSRYFTRIRVNAEEKAAMPAVSDPRPPRASLSQRMSTFWARLKQVWTESEESEESANSTAMEDEDSDAVTLVNEPGKCPLCIVGRVEGRSSEPHDG